MTKTPDPKPYTVEPDYGDDDHVGLHCPGCDHVFTYPAERRGEHTGCPGCGVNRHIPMEAS